MLLSPPDTGDTSPPGNTDKGQIHPKKPFRAFISYRREGVPELALLIQSKLEKQGVDAFLDITHLGPHYFDTKLLREIERRLNFIVILSPHCLDGCAREGDWFRREIAHAIATDRNIIPIMLKGFEFPPKEKLPPDIAEVIRYNSLRYYVEYHQAFLERLKNFLRPDDSPAKRKEPISIPPEPPTPPEGPNSGTTDPAPREKEVIPPPQKRLTFGNLSTNPYVIMSALAALGLLLVIGMQIKGMVFPDAMTSFQKGQSFLENKNYDQAIRYFNQALELKPGWEAAYLKRGEALFQKGDYESAITDFTRAQEHNPGNAEAYYRRGLVYLKKGLFDQAILDCNRALELNPQGAKAYHVRAIAFTKKGRVPQAIEDCNRALAQDPTLTMVYWDKAVFLELAARFHEAIEAYKGFLNYATPEYAPPRNQAEQKIRNLERNTQDRDWIVIVGSFSTEAMHTDRRKPSTGNILDFKPASGVLCQVEQCIR